jgi:transcriptional regulator with XRE-family HTH domain
MADTDREARERFAANLERLRRRDGLSVERLAARAQLEGILRTENDADYTTIALLAGALGVEPGELFRGIRWIPPGDREGGRHEVGQGE